MNTVDDFINKCDFDDNDMDTATSGFCATFALALYKALLIRHIESQLILICLRKGNVPYRNKKNQLTWRHACVRVDGKYYDVEGQVLLDDMIENYCWGHTGDDGGIAVPVTPEQLIDVMRQTPSSWDKKYYDRMINRFSSIS